jgi:hypothetical protein
MQQDSLGPGANPRRNAEVNAGWVDVPELVDGERALVRHDAPLTAPEGPAHEVLVGTRRPFRKTEDSPPDAKPVLVERVVVLGGVGIAGFEGLACGEVPCLRGGDLDEPFPESLPDMRAQRAASFTKTIGIDRSIT